MKRTIFIFTVLFLLLICGSFVCYSAGEFDYDFRKIYWEMSNYEVMASEAIEPDFIIENLISYNVEIFSMDATLSYYFKEKKLGFVMLSIAEEYKNDNKCIRDFEKLKKLYMQKYGEPISNEINWLDETYRDKPEKHGLAVSKEHLKQKIIWETNRTVIYLNLAGKDEEPFILISYHQKPHEKEEHENDINGLRWGMSKEEVLSIKNLDNDDVYDNQIITQSKFALMDATVFYDFFFGKLYSVGYLFTEDYTNENDYIANFLKLKELLTAQYGKPTEDNLDWINNQYIDDHEKYGLAILAGHLRMHTIWDNKKTKIALLIKGSNFDISLGLIYVSNEYAEHTSNAVEDDPLDYL